MNVTGSVDLRQACVIRSGGTPSKSNPGYWLGDTPWVSPKDMKSTTIAEASDHISEEALASSAASLAPAGSTLVVVRSGVLVHSFPVATITRAMSFNQDIKALTPRSNSGLTDEYLFWFLRAKAKEVVTRGVKKGATVHSLKAGYLESLRIPLKPIDEQKELTDRLQRAEGIVRLRREAQRKAAELIPALFLDRFGDPARNPKTWPSARLREIVTLRGGGTPSKSRPELWAGSLPWVTPKDMKSNEVWNSIDHVSDLALDQSAVRLIPRDSILIVVRGMILVHTVPIAQAKVELTVNQDMKALLVRDGIDLNTQYLLWCLRALHDSILARVTSAAHGTRKLETPRLLDLEVPLPGLHEQHAFAAEAIRVMEIQRAQSEAQLCAQATFDALLHRAFAS